jgi:ectoine hydroxylase-related dioxygenase (phytanoyl-CoA dioxygenase family)
MGTSSLLRDQLDALRGDAVEKWNTDGYVVLENAVPVELCSSILADIREAFDTSFQNVTDERIPGTISGHLNCFPGSQARSIVQYITDSGIHHMMETVFGGPLVLVSVGCNINVPGSSDQNFHIDGEWGNPFVVVNLSLVDTNLENGPTEIVAGTQNVSMRYWEFFIKGYWSRRKRYVSRVGDILIRPSTLWHRGTRNRSRVMRPMIGLVYAPPGPTVSEADFSQFNGKVAFLGNRFSASLAGRISEIRS